MRIILFSLWIISIVGCKKPITNNYSEISIILDKTDSSVLYPKPEPIIKEFYLGQFNNRGAVFHYTEISNLKLVPVTTLLLPNKNVTDSQNGHEIPFLREKLILSFYDSIKTILKQTSTINITLPKSQCFHTIANQLTILAKSNADHKLLCVYSNLIENTTTLNFYDKKTQSTLFQTPASIEKTFEDTHLLPVSLKGVTILFIYRPLNEKDDFLYNAIVEIYLVLLKKRGAKCVVQATNNF